MQLAEPAKDTGRASALRASPLSSRPALLTAAQVIAVEDAEHPLDPPTSRSATGSPLGASRSRMT